MTTKYIAKTGSGYTADFYADNGTTNQVVIQQAIDSLTPFVGDKIIFYPGIYICDRKIYCDGIDIEGSVSFTPSDVTYTVTPGANENPNVATLKIKSGITDYAHWSKYTCFINTTSSHIKNMVFDGNRVANRTHEGDSYLNLLHCGNSSTIENCRFQNCLCDAVFHGSYNTIQNNYFICVLHEGLRGGYNSYGMAADGNIINKNIFFYPFTTSTIPNWWYNAAWRLYAGKNNVFTNNIISSPNRANVNIGIIIVLSGDVNSINNIIENNIIDTCPNECAIWFFEVGLSKTRKEYLSGQIVKNNIIANTDYAILFSADKTLAQWNNISIINNTFVNISKRVIGEYWNTPCWVENGVTKCANSNIRIQSPKLSGPIYIKNNILQNSPVGILSDANCAPQWLMSSYNCFYNVTTKLGIGVIDLGNSIEANPLLTSDYHLQTGSLAINAGDNGKNMGADPDLIGQPTCPLPQFRFEITQQV